MKILLAAMAALLAFANVATADTLPKELLGTWCLSSIEQNGDLHIYQHPPCSNKAAQKLEIMPYGFFSIVKKTTMLCAAPSSLESGPKTGWIFEVAFGADDNSTPVYRVKYFMYSMTNNRLGVINLQAD
jgi:hypothetical protein